VGRRGIGPLSLESAGKSTYAYAATGSNKVDSAGQSVCASVGWFDRVQLLKRVVRRMSQLPAWLSLVEAVSQIRERGILGKSAKVDICTAVATLKILVKVTLDEGAPEVLESNDVDLPLLLTPNDFDWGTSRPRGRWRVRRQGSDNWRLCAINRVLLRGEDVRQWFCGEIGSVLLMEVADSSAHPQSGRWVPSQGSATAIAKIDSRSEISLDEAISLMTFGARSAPTGLRRFEIDAKMERPERALCKAAFERHVRLRGFPTRAATDLRDVSSGYPFRRAGEPDMLGPNYEKVGPDLHYRRWVAERDDTALDEDHDREWFNVRVEPASFLEWVSSEVTSERWSELRRSHSRRLFDRPLWSIQTAVCWIAFRDPSRLETDPNDAHELIMQVDPYSLDGDALVEYQPEIKLLIELRSGDLAALDDVGDSVPVTRWLESYPVSGTLWPKSPLFRLDRAQVLRRFPELTKSSQAAESESRRDQIALYATRMNKTREWISVAEIGDWFAFRHTDPSRTRNRRRKTIEMLRASQRAGEFCVKGENCVVLQHPKTSIETFDHEPVDRIVEDDREPQTDVIDFFESCWLPNEVCRQWFAIRGLKWPHHFKMSGGAGQSQAGIVENPSPNPAGRPAVDYIFRAALAYRIDKRLVQRRVGQEAIQLETWQKSFLVEGKQVTHDAIENMIREDHKKWVRENPGKS
jgi:hypothetical protein